MTKEEAIKILKNFHDKSALFSVRTALETLYPELKESEDEKIIKILYEGVHDVLQDQFCTNRGVSKEKVLSWLEKQGECHISHDDEIMIKQLTEYFTTGHKLQNTNETVVEWLNDVKEKLEKQGEQKPFDYEHANIQQKDFAPKVEPKCEESKTKVFDAPTPFEDKLYAFVAACEFLAIPSKIEFILEHSQEILDAAREQIGKEQSSTWSKEDERLLNNMIIVIKDYYNDKDAQSLISWLKSLKPQSQWKPSDEQMATLYKYAEQNNYDGSILTSLYNDLKKLREE